MGSQHKSGKSICIVRKNRTRTSASEEDFNNFLTERGCPKSNERYTKFGVFDKLNHRNANLLDSPMTSFLSFAHHFICDFCSDKLNQRNHYDNYDYRNYHNTCSETLITVTDCKVAKSATA